MQVQGADDGRATRNLLAGLRRGSLKEYGVAPLREPGMYVARAGEKTLWTGLRKRQCNGYEKTWNRTKTQKVPLENRPLFFSNAAIPPLPKMKSCFLYSVLRSSLRVFRTSQYVVITPLSQGQRCMEHC